MKARRLLAAFIASAMVLGTMSIPAFAEDEAQMPTDEAVIELQEESVEGTAAPAGEPTVAPTVAPAETPSEEPIEEYAAKIGDVGYRTLDEAITAAKYGETVKLVSDISKISTVEIGKDKNITLDLCGYKIDAAVRSDNAAKHYYAIDNYGTFTLTDTVGGGVISARGIENLENGKMIINGGTIKSIDTNGGASIWNEADLTINGGTFETTHVGVSSDSVGIGCLNNSGTALITAGDFIDVNARTYAIISTGHIEITPADGKTVKVTGKHGALAVDAGTAVVNGGNYSSTDYYGLYVSNDGVGVDPMTAAVTVNGGTFDGPSFSVWIGSDYNNPVNSTIEIVGGTYKKPLNAQECTREGAISVKGGTFTTDVSEYVAEGYAQTRLADGTYQVLPVIARVGETGYATLADAVAAAQSGGTVTLLDDAAGNGIVNDKDITIDLGGHTYTIDGTTVGSSGTETNGFQLLAGKDTSNPHDVTIKNGTILATSKTAQIMIQNYSDLTLEDVVLDGRKLTGWAYALSNNCGNVVIKGNTSIYARSSGVAFDSCKFSSYPIPTVTVETTGTINGKVELTGGNLIVKSGTFTTSVKDYVAKGYMQVKNSDGTYTVTESAATVIDTAKGSNYTVTLDNLHINDKVNPENGNATYAVTVNTAPADEKALIENSITDKPAVVETVDIKVIKTADGKQEEVSGITNQKVTIKLQAAATDKPRVFYIDNGRSEEIAANEITWNGTDEVSFIAPHFSTYTVAYNQSTPDESDITKKVKVAFERVTDNEYDIVLKGVTGATYGDVINRFMSTDLTFEYTPGTTEPGNIGYTITPAANMTIAYENSGRYEIHMDGNPNSSATGNAINIGKVIFDGYGKGRFTVKSADTNIVNTAERVDNIVNDYKTDGDGYNTGMLVISNPEGIINVELKPETRKLAMNIAFNNAVANNAYDYQDMTVTISGGDLTANKVIKLGTNPVLTNTSANVVFNDAERAYEISIDDELTLNTNYTVTVEGAGYRTARYTVRMTADKTLNFWNNVMDTAQVVEVNKPDSVVKTNFLAGDIVKDNNINIYDLSAVVSYFGENNLVLAHPEYAKYDLNRDGKIDSKDVAYVLVSWNN